VLWGDKMAMDYKKEKEGWTNVSNGKGKI